MKNDVKHNCKNCGNMFWNNKLDFVNPPECPKCKSKNTTPWKDAVIVPDKK